MNDIYRALLNGIPEESFKIKQVVIGIHWTVVLSRYTGMASTLQAPRPHGKTPMPAAGEFEGQNALQVAEYLLSVNRLEASLGLAAINSMLPIDPERCENINALEVLLRKGKKKKVGVIGHFPFVNRLRRELQDVVVFEKNPQPGDLSDDRMASILPDCEVVGMSATTLINHSIEEVLGYCYPGAYKIMIGPSTPMSDVLFDFGLDLLAGTRITDTENLIRYVSQGASFRQIKGAEVVTMQKKNAAKDSHTC